MNPVKPVSEEFEVVEDSWVSKHPSGVVSAVAAALVSSVLGGNYWVEQRQAPQFDKIQASMKRLELRDEHLAAFQIESSRRTREVLSLIANSANITLPEPQPELKRAEERVRDIKERAD